MRTELQVNESALASPLPLSSFTPENVKTKPLPWRDAISWCQEGWLNPLNTKHELSTSRIFKSFLLIIIRDHGSWKHFGSGFGVINFFPSLILYGKQTFEMNGLADV